MEPKITPIDATLGAVVTDLDLSHIEKHIEPSRADGRVVDAKDDLIAAGGLGSPCV